MRSLGPDCSSKLGIRAPSALCGPRVARRAVQRSARYRFAVGTTGMTNPVQEDIGKYLAIAKANATIQTEVGQVARVLEHAITPGVTGDDRTSLAIFSSQERVDELIEDVKKADSRSESFVSFVEQKAQKLLPLCNNSRLSSIFGGGVWNQLFLATTARVDPSTYHLRMDIASRRRRRQRIFS